METIIYKEIQYIPDSQVDEAMDEKIRKILNTCFPSGEVFKHQRFYNDLPQHRFFIEKDEEIIAHLAVHERQFEAEGVQESFFGLAELCVLPEFQRLNLAKKLITHVEKFFSWYDYSILMGEPMYYSSSGYNRVSNVIFAAIPHVPMTTVMVKCMKDKTWPAGSVVIDGLPF